MRCLVVARVALIVSLTYMGFAIVDNETARVCAKWYGLVTLSLIAIYHWERRNARRA